MELTKSFFVVLCLIVKPLHCTQVRTETMKLVDSDSVYGDSFGYEPENSNCIAVTDKWLVVGSYLDDVNGVKDVGSVTVFPRSRANVDLNGTKIFAPLGGMTDQQFGANVAANERYIVVACMGGNFVYDKNVYIFDADNNFSLVQTLKVNLPRMIMDVGINEDNVIVVAARCEKVEDNVFIFTLDTDHWKLQQTIIGNLGRPYRVAISALHIAIGMLVWKEQFKNWLTDVFIYTKQDNGSWVETKRLVNPMEDVWVSQDEFGRKFNLRSNTLIVTKVESSRRGITKASTRAFVYRYVDKTWKLVANLSASIANYQGELNDLSVDVFGDTAVVGIKEFKVPHAAGAAFLFHLDKATNSWNETEMLQPSDASQYNFFGNPVRIHDNVVFVGSSNSRRYHYFDSRGAVYIYDLSRPPPKTTSTTTPPPIRATTTPPPTTTPSPTTKTSSAWVLHSQTLYFPITTSFFFVLYFALEY